MQRSLIAAVLLCTAVAPLRAQLAVTSRIQVEDTSRQEAKSRFANRYNTELMGLETRITKDAFNVKTFVRDGAVRVEGFGPLVGLTDHVVLLVRDGKYFWLDPDGQVFFEELTLPAGLLLQWLGASSNVESKADGTDKLLGRDTAISRTEITVKDLPANPMGASESAMASWPITRPTPEPPYYPRLPVDQPPALVALGQEATGRDYERAGATVRDRRIIVRTWTTKEFGGAGTLAAGAGVTATLDRMFNLKPDGLPLRQLVQATSSNGNGQRWETVVTSISTHTLPASAFEVPPSYAKVQKPVTLIWAR